MTDRLEKAIRLLTPAEVEQLTQYAESLAANPSVCTANPGDPAKLDWIGGLKDGPYRDGLDAQEAAKLYRLFLLERGMSK
jgi:hypothetical protein